MEHHIYKRHFIKSVIFRLDFPIPIPSLEGLERPNEFQRSVLISFPRLDESKVVKQEMKFGPDGISNTQKDTRIYNFRNQDRTCQIGLESTFLFIEHKAYIGYDEFIKLVDLAVDSLFTAWPNTPVTRLGLRYINEIDAPSKTDVLDWSEYINPNLLSAVGTYGGADKLSRYIVQTELRGDGYFSRILAGMPNPDYPGLISKRHYVIDIDLYTNESVEKQEIRPKLDAFHDAIISFFQSSITQGLKDIMDA